LVLVSGDIAYAGDAKEYSLAESWFSALEADLRDSNADVEYALTSIPGNHDCVLPELQVALRKTLITGIQPTIGSSDPDVGIVGGLLAAQNQFFNFEEKISCRLYGNMDEQVCRAELVTLKGLRIQINKYNTALLSQRHEQQGSLKMPIQVLDRCIQPFEDIHLSLAMFHYSYGWIKQCSGVPASHRGNCRLRFDRPSTLSTFIR
jgi:hypothetical protein